MSVNNDIYDSESDSFRTQEEFRKMHMISLIKTIKILCFQILFTFSVITMFTFNKFTQSFLQNHIVNLLTLGCIGSVCTILYMSYFNKMTIRYLTIFTIFETMTLCAAISIYDSQIVRLAMISTLGITTGLAIYTLLTSNNNTTRGIGSYLYAGLICLLAMGSVNLFVQSDTVHLIELFFGTIIF